MGARGVKLVYRMALGYGIARFAVVLLRYGGRPNVLLRRENAFYNADPDCAAFTNMVRADVNLDFLEMCALTGMTTLASVTPGILKPDEMKRINAIFKIADEGKGNFGIKDYEKNADPERFISADGKTEKFFNWNRVYNGSRVVLSWME